MIRMMNNLISKSLFTLVSSCIMVSTFACKKTNFSRAQYDGTELMGVDTASLQSVAGVTDTASAGQKARSLSAFPTELDQPASGGLSLAEPQSSLRAGDRICVSADYGRGGEGATGNSHETAAKCGVLERCDQRSSWYRDLPAQAGDLCMRADCLSKTGAGLDMPGEILSDGTPCMQGQGRSTAFNVSEYFRGLAAFAYDARISVGASLTSDSSAYDNGFMRGDRQYQSTAGLAGKTVVSLADETLFQGEVFLTHYRTNNLGLNKGGEDAIARVGTSRGTSGRTVIALFEEGGSAVNSATGNESVVSTSNNGPSPAQLGLVRTRQGNNFALQGGDMSGGWLGPAGTVKVLIGGR